MRATNKTILMNLTTDVNDHLVLTVYKYSLLLAVNLKILTWYVRHILIHDGQFAWPFVIVGLESHFHCNSSWIKKKRKVKEKRAKHFLRTEHFFFELFLANVFYWCMEH